MKFLAESGADAGGIEIYPTSAPKYAFTHCTDGYTNFDSVASNVISELEGDSAIWTVVKTPGQVGEGPRIEIELNEKPIVDFKISGTSCGKDNWSFWTREVREIQFSNWDTASDFYKPPPEKCDGLKTEWNYMETETQFPVDKGTKLTVSCTGSYKLVGDSEITCNGNDDFLYDSAKEPQCGEFQLE